MLFQNCDSYYSVGQRSGESIAGYNLDSKAQSILSQNCYTCHTDTQSAGGVSHMEDTNLLVNDGVIIPGDAETSPLINALESSSTLAHALSDQSLAILRSWVISLEERFPTPNTPQPPACTLTVDRTSIVLGETVNATLQVSGKATSALIHGLPASVLGASRPVSPTTTGTIMAQVSNMAGTTICQSPSVQVTTPAVNPGSLIPQCTLIASTTMAVPGDDVTLELAITGTATSASINSVAVAIPASGAFPSVIVKPMVQTTYSARVNGGGSFNTCSATVATKTAAQLTKDEFYRAKIGPGGLSVDDLLIKPRRSQGTAYGGSCITCHNNTPPSQYSRARNFLVLVSNDQTLNLNDLKDITDPADTTRRWNLTVATPTNPPISLHAYAAGHFASASYFSSSAIYTYRYTTNELAHIKAFVDKP